MPVIKSIKDLQEYIKGHYDPRDVGGCWWDTGNFDDSYEYGRANGRTHTLHMIGKLIGMDLPVPDEIEIIG